MAKRLFLNLFFGAFLVLCLWSAVRRFYRNDQLLAVVLLVGAWEPASRLWNTLKGRLKHTDGNNPECELKI